VCWFGRFGSKDEHEYQSKQDQQQRTKRIDPAPAFREVVALT
jgi:hypothetical protein